MTDPERLLGGDGSYMMDLLLGSDELDWISGAGDEPSRWRLLVLEDAGELLAADAPARVGLGFSRLLNTVDGLIGQGTRALVLVTTNEPLGKLHPAVTRAGRRLAETEFAPLNREPMAPVLGQVRPRARARREQRRAARSTAKRCPRISSQSS